VFEKVLEMLKEEGLLKGNKVGLDATNLEANAALRSIPRKIDGKRYTAYLRKLSRQVGQEETSREDLARFDRTRPDKSCSNQNPENPNDPEARIAKMKNGSTHLAYKTEHALDPETGALVAAVIRGSDKADTETIWETVAAAGQNLHAVQKRCQQEGEILKELVADKAYRSNAALVGLEEFELRSYLAEPDRGRRRWRGDERLRDRRAVHANRRRIRRPKGPSLQRLRGEPLERSIPHMLDTGGHAQGLAPRQVEFLQEVPDPCLSVQPPPADEETLLGSRAQAIGGPAADPFAPSFRAPYCVHPRLRALQTPCARSFPVTNLPTSLRHNCLNAATGEPYF